MANFEVISYGLDYIRFAVETDQDVRAIQMHFDYLNLQPVWHHGLRFIDITGSQMAVIRTIEDMLYAFWSLASVHRVTRIDFYIDVEGLVLHKCKQPGTVIMNGGNVETIYSHKLSNRGHHSVFLRAYDAQEAGHYDVPVTRFEVEFKREIVPGLIDHKQGVYKAIAGVALHHIERTFDVKLKLTGFLPIEYKPTRERLKADRGRFYTRYGKGIVNDIEEMGIEQFCVFVYSCYYIKEEKRAKEKQGRGAYWNTERCRDTIPVK